MTSTKPLTLGSLLSDKLIKTFYARQHNAIARLCDSDVSVCPSVCLSVCHTPVLCLAERKQNREMYTI